MNKNIIVTGGAQGIGKIVSQELLKNEYSVSVFEIDDEAIKEFQSEVNSTNMAFFRTDVADEKNVQQSISASNKKFGNISGLINNAAIHDNKPMVELTFEAWNRVISVNLSGTFLCAKYAAPFLKKSKGSIINMSSTRAFQSEPNTEAYSASKGGIYSLTHALAMSLGPEIRVNSISPGWIDVSGIRKKSEAKKYQQTEEDKKQHPAGRVGNAKDISNMVLFLLNPENSFITGQNFIVDGGMTQKMIYV
ncbi:SDR family oxidoreductase [Maribellus comscasis]|uniref:SDR family oxidoreductase n=1 Tax=Maribellus comscasis TaxID=2681766 RepID=A0A6I6JUC9_9BACT|nr:SDR family oxidoreductase [Maribellus comscasis]QGY46715.1 SDR family oxidoreductase [Maribellus comscasis]